MVVKEGVTQIALCDFPDVSEQLLQDRLVKPVAERDADIFGGRFGVRGPDGSPQAAATWPVGMVRDKWPDSFPEPVRYIR